MSSSKKKAVNPGITCRACAKPPTPFRLSQACAIARALPSLLALRMLGSGNMKALLHSLRREQVLASPAQFSIVGGVPASPNLGGRFLLTVEWKFPPHREIEREKWGEGRVWGEEKSGERDIKVEQRVFHWSVSSSPHSWASSVPSEAAERSVINVICCGRFPSHEIGVNILLILSRMGFQGQAISKHILQRPLRSKELMMFRNRMLLET